MARAQDVNSADSQFFICFDDASFLDGKYTVWGQVIEGMENVDKIKKGAAERSVSESRQDRHRARGRGRELTAKRVRRCLGNGGASASALLAGRGRRGGMAEFELGFRLTQEDWRKYRQSYMRRFQQGARGHVCFPVARCTASCSSSVLDWRFVLGLLQKLGWPQADRRSACWRDLAWASPRSWSGRRTWSHRVEQWGHDGEGGYVLGPRRSGPTTTASKWLAPITEARFRWSAFEDFTENGGVALLWLDRGAAVIVPHSAFGDMLVKAGLSGDGCAAKSGQGRAKGCNTPTPDASCWRASRLAAQREGVA